MMKGGLKILLMVAAVAAPLEGSAQVLGIRGGFTRSTLSGDEFENGDSSRGLGVSLHLRFDVASNLGLEIGAGYTQKGGSGLESGVEVALDIDYLEFPVLAVFSPSVDGRIRPRFYAGPVFSFEASCDAVITGGAETLSGDCDKPPFTGDFERRSFDYGVLAGAGVSIGVGGRVQLTLDASYDLGLRSLESVADRDKNNRNRSLAITTGLSFPLGG